MIFFMLESEVATFFKKIFSRTEARTKKSLLYELQKSSYNFSRHSYGFVVFENNDILVVKIKICTTLSFSSFS